MGEKAHTDLLDGVEWARATGYVDETRTAIYGGSYGGYAALVGATFTPDVFTCSTAIVGFSNIFTLMKSFPSYVSNQLTIWHQRIGHPEKDKELLKSISPYFHAHQIKCPVLVAQGGK